MTFAYPTAQPAHADPCDPAYHVYCPRCGAWVAGAWAVLPPWEVTATRRVHCAQCGTTAPGSFDPDLLLSFGPYSGRPISSLRSPTERGVLEAVLQVQCRAHSPGSFTDPTPDPRRELRLAVLHQLGWLDPARQLRPPGPDISRWQQAQETYLASYQRRAERDQRERERVAQEQRGADWAEQVRRESARRERENQARQERRRLPEPAPTETGGWVRFLGLVPPITARTVRQAYYRLSKSYHPDVGGSDALMQQLNGAKSQADAWLAQGGPAKVPNGT